MTARSPAAVEDSAPLIPYMGTAGGEEFKILTCTVLKTINTTRSLNCSHSKTNKISSYPWYTEIQLLVY